MHQKLRDWELRCPVLCRGAITWAVGKLTNTRRERKDPCVNPVGCLWENPWLIGVPHPTKSSLIPGSEGPGTKRGHFMLHELGFNQCFSTQEHRLIIEWYLTSKVISIFPLSPIKLLTLYEITIFCENSTINISGGVPYRNCFLPLPAPLPEPRKSPVGHVYECKLGLS